jgi:hypothetical protein
VLRLALRTTARRHGEPQREGHRLALHPHREGVGQVAEELFAEGEERPLGGILDQHVVAEI